MSVANNDRYIIGDSEEKLALIKENSIKLIYVDPPYNTGSKFAYNDSRARQEWADFMRPKLIESQRVLTEDGVIFISIDDNEYDVLKKLCDEIFGEKNKLGTLITRQATRSNSKHINTIHEYVLCYAKDKNKTTRFETKRINIPTYGQTIKKLIRTVKAAYKKDGRKAAEAKLKNLLDHYDHIDGYSWLKNYNSIDEEGNIYFAKDLSTPGEPNTLSIPEINLELKPLKTRRWTNKKRMIELHEKNLLVYKNGRPYRKSLLIDSKDALMSVLNFYSRQGTHDLDRLGLKGVFDTPKPVDMIKLFILCVCRDGDTVLDFMAGSATTGQAVWEVRKEMNLNLNFILIQISEPLTHDSKVGKLLKDNGLELDLANVGVLRLNRVKQKLGEFDFTLE